MNSNKSKTGTNSFSSYVKQTSGIRTQLYGGFAAIGAILLIAGAVILVKITFATSFATQVVKVDFPLYAALLDLNGEIYHSQSSLESWLLNPNEINKKEALVALHNIERLQIELNNLKAKNDNPYFIETWKSASPLIDKLTTEIRSISSKPITTSSIINFETTIHPIAIKILDVIDGPENESGNRTGGLFDRQSSTLHDGIEEMIKGLNLISIIEYVSVALCLFLAIVIAVLTARRILAPLQNMINSVVTITSQITDACNNMVVTIEEVKRAVEAQSAGASEQSASINQITSSLEEIEKSSVQTIDKAKMLGDVAERTHERGQVGLQSVEQSVSGMKDVRSKVQLIARTILDLSNQTKQVGEITAVVNTLAQQSKMLALNAAIEAAKAGEAGKGFAVVAAEVKNLAEQSEQSTTQVQKILEDIKAATERAVVATEEGTKRVDEGSYQVEQTGETVRGLNEVIHEANIASQQIEAAIRQEGIGIEQIAAGMNEINQVTGSFVDSVRQTTDAMAHLAVIAKTLKEQVDIYKL